MAEPRHSGPKEYSGEKARQGEIVLRTRWRRIVFLGGLAGIAVVLLLTALLA